MLRSNVAEYVLLRGIIAGATIGAGYATVGGVLVGAAPLNIIYGALYGLFFGGVPGTILAILLAFVLERTVNRFEQPITDYGRVRLALGAISTLLTMALVGALTFFLLELGTAPLADVLVAGLIPVLLSGVAALALSQDLATRVLHDPAYTAHLREKIIAPTYHMDASGRITRQRSVEDSAETVPDTDDDSHTDDAVRQHEETADILEQGRHR